MLFNNAFAAEDIQAEYSLKSEVNRLTELLKKNELNPQILVEIALLHYDRGDFTQAREYYQKALAIDPWLDIDDLENIK
jgi:tetratricopeptide (TPR) repeat protein